MSTRQNIKICPPDKILKSFLNYIKAEEMTNLKKRHDHNLTEISKERPILKAKIENILIQLNNTSNK